MLAAGIRDCLILKMLVPCDRTTRILQNDLYDDLGSTGWEIFCWCWFSFLGLTVVMNCKRMP